MKRVDSAYGTRRTSGVRSSRLMREVNVGLSSLCGEYDTAHTIGFFCECTAPNCSSVVWMTGAAFAAHAARAENGWIVVTGHSGPQQAAARGLEHANEAVAVPASEL